MPETLREEAHCLCAYWWWASQLVGTVVLLLLLAWLVSTIFELFRPRRLLDCLHERVVLVTGCDSGFGAGLARRLDALGVPVVAGCLFPDGPGARQLATECSSRLRVVPLDVTSQQQVDNAVTFLEDILADRKLWAVVNNAGVLEGGEAELLPLEAYERSFAVNMLGVVRVTQTCLPLIRQSRGRIVTVASPLGRTAMPMLSAYCSSKSAVTSFSDTLRVEMKKWGVSVCTVEPTSYVSDLNCPDNFKATVTKNFQESPGRVRRDYPDKYDTKCVDRLSVLTMVAKSRSAINEVIDELVDACVGRHFQRQRIPGYWEKVVYNVLPRLPNYVKDWIMYVVFQWRVAN